MKKDIKNINAKNTKRHPLIAEQSSSTGVIARSARDKAISKTIHVKNAEGDPDTTAEILIQNQIDYTPKVSVIIPVYNVEQYLRECLDSVVNQTLKEIEIICVDDGSTDNSLNILKEYASKDKRITVITQQNLHAGVARNAGLTVATGKYIHFLDSDDWVDLNTYAKLYNIINSKKANFIKFKSYSFDLVKNEIIDNYYTEQPFHKNDAWISVDKSAPLALKTTDAPWSGLYKSSFIQKNKIRFDNLICANDVAFYFRCLLKSRKFYFSTEKFVYYRINNNKSLVKIRPLNFECQIKLYHNIQRIAHQEKESLKNLLDEKFCKDILWRHDTYLKNAQISQQIKNRIKKLTATFFMGNVHQECRKTYLNNLIQKENLNNWLKAYLFFPFFYFSIQKQKKNFLTSKGN